MLIVVMVVFLQLELWTSNPLITLSLNKLSYPSYYIEE